MQSAYGFNKKKTERNTDIGNIKISFKRNYIFCNRTVYSNTNTQLSYFRSHMSLCFFCTLFFNNNNFVSYVEFYSMVGNILL